MGVLLIIAVGVFGESGGGVDTAGFIKLITKRVKLVLHDKITKTDPTKWTHAEHHEAAQILGDALVQLGGELEEEVAPTRKHKHSTTLTPATKLKELQREAKFFQKLPPMKKQDACHPNFHKQIPKTLRSKTIRREAAELICKKLKKGKLAQSRNRLVKKFHRKCEKLVQSKSPNFVNIDAVLDEHASIDFRLRKSTSILKLATAKTVKNIDKGDIMAFACPKIKAIENYNKNHVLALIEQGSFSAEHKKMANSMVNYLECACNEKNQGRCSKRGSQALARFMNVFDKGLNSNLYAGSKKREKAVCAKEKMGKPILKTGKSSSLLQTRSRRSRSSRSSRRSRTEFIRRRG